MKMPAQINAAGGLTVCGFGERESRAMAPGLCFNN
jgi:hypothetical protein